MNRVKFLATFLVVGVTVMVVAWYAMAFLPRNSIATFLVIGVAVMVGASTLSPAQTGPITQSPVSRLPMTPPSEMPSQPVPVNLELTPETLKTMLTNLGYEFTEQKLERLSLFCIKVSQAGVDSTVNVCLRTDHK